MFRVCLKKLLVYFVTLIIGLKLCNAAAVSQKALKRESSKTVESSAESENSVADTKNSPLTSYYRQAPYGPQTYAFGFEVNDKKTKNRQFRDERRFLNGTVEGSYGYLRPDGLVSVTHYLTDEKTGYLSQTQTFDLTQNNTKPLQFDLRAEFQATEKPDVFFEHPENVQDLDQNTMTALKKDYNIDVNHINVTKDLLSPSLWNIVSGKVPLKNLEANSTQASQNGSQLGFETFEKIIPNNFPIVPFKLPDNAENVGHDMSTEHKVETTTTTRTTTTKTTAMPTPKPLDAAEHAENNADWVSKIVNETRKEFLENIPNLL